MGAHSISTTSITTLFRTLAVDLAQLSAQVETQLADAVGAFERRDVALAERTIAVDSRIDAAHAAIEAKVMDILRNAPLADRQLREAMSALKVAGELERVGDLAKNVAKRTLVICRDRSSQPVAGVARMGRASLRQISDILTAVSKEDLKAAEAVWGGDDDLDELYNSVYREILLEMMKEPGQVNAGTHLVFIAKNFERVGDHATNIAEALHFLLTGAPFAAARPKGDETSVTAVSPNDKR